MVRVRNAAGCSTLASPRVRRLSSPTPHHLAIHLWFGCEGRSWLCASAKLPGSSSAKASSHVATASSRPAVRLKGTYHLSRGYAERGQNDVDERVDRRDFHDR